MLSVLYLRNRYQTQGFERLPLCFLLRFLVLTITFNLLANFGLVAIYNMKYSFNFIGVLLSQCLHTSVFSPTLSESILEHQTKWKVGGHQRAGASPSYLKGVFYFEEFTVYRVTVSLKK